MRFVKSNRTSQNDERKDKKEGGKIHSFILAKGFDDRDFFFIGSKRSKTFPIELLHYSSLDQIKILEKIFRMHLP